MKQDSIEYFIKNNNKKRETKIIIKEKIKEINNNILGREAPNMLKKL